MKNKKTIIVILVLIILISIVFIFKSNKGNIKFDDILFLKLFHNSEEKKDNEYSFQVRYKNTQSQTINLLNTTNTSIKEKICPGTQGEFSILLNSKDKLKYKIEFKSLNQKPKNLQFEAYINGIKVGEGGSLEELEDNLKGEIKPTETVRVIIKWWWNYEDFARAYPKDTEDKDKQDTQDGKNLEKYDFEINASGEKEE